MPYSFPTWDEFQALANRVRMLELGTPGFSDLPGVPQNLVATPQQTNWGVEYVLSWDEVPGAAYYKLYRLSGPDYITYSWSTQGSETTMTLGVSTNPTPTDTEHYISAVNAYGESAMSAPVLVPR